MNQKKCPKCGENNPPEAVMCWACYTPLSGGAVAAGASPGVAGAVATTRPNVAEHEEKEKKPVAPWQIGVVVLALLIGVGFGVSQFMGGGSDTVADTPSLPQTDPGVQDPGTVAQQPYSPPPPSAPAVTSTESGGAATPPTFVPYDMVSAPNTQLSWGVMAIVPTQANVSDSKAASLAAFARRQYQNPNWRAVHIYVFADRQTALQFKEYQRGRKSNVLGPGDMAALTNLWSRCLVRYEFTGGRESVRYPSKNPTGWWVGRR